MSPHVRAVRYPLPVDPTQGDAHLVVTDDRFSPNLSTLTIVGTLEGYGIGPRLRSAYVPGADRISGTYLPGAIPGPGFMLQLDHRNSTVLISLFGLPTGLGNLVADGFWGTVLVGLHRRLAQRPTRPARDRPGKPTRVRTGPKGTGAPGPGRASGPER